MNKLRIYDCNFDNKYSDEEIISYINSLKHNSNCSREVKDKYNSKDSRIGEALVLSEIHRLYSCYVCGSIYSVKDI